MALDLNSYFGLHAKALQLREQRSAVIASNLANVDTPNYKAKDLDFKTILKQANGNSIKMSGDNPNHLNAQDSAFATMKFRVTDQISLDGNTVDKDIETTQFAANSVAYQASLTFLTSKIKTVMTALRGE
jgi:flagellar basal-body rod protein FlgB